MLYVGVDPSAVLSESPISASFDAKRVLWYALHNISSYQNLISTGNLGKIKVWNSFSPSIFFYIIDLFTNLQITTEWECAFLNTAIIIFRLIYSLNIPHSNQNPSFVPVERSVSILSKFTFRQHFTISLSFEVTRKFNISFRVILSIVTGDGNIKFIVCLLFPGSQTKFSWVSQVY